MHEPWPESKESEKLDFIDLLYKNTKNLYTILFTWHSKNFLTPIKRFDNHPTENLDSPLATPITLFAVSFLSFHLTDDT